MFKYSISHHIIWDGFNVTMHFYLTSNQIFRQDKIPFHLCRIFISLNELFFQHFTSNVIRCHPLISISKHIYIYIYIVQLVTTCQPRQLRLPIFHIINRTTRQEYEHVTSHLKINKTHYAVENYFICNLKGWLKGYYNL